MVCKNMDELEKVLKQKITSAMNETLKPKVENVMKRHIKSDVYDKWTPKRYQRRGNIDGLGDEDNVIVNVLGFNDEYVFTDNYCTLVAYNDTRTNKFLNGVDTDYKRDFNGWTQRGYSQNMDKEFLTPIIESGKGYDYITGHPRPFMHNIYEELLNGVAKNTLIRGLEKQGLNVKK